jgi:hypothetical protein
LSWYKVVGFFFLTDANLFQTVLSLVTTLKMLLLGQTTSFFQIPTPLPLLPDCHEVTSFLYQVLSAMMFCLKTDPESTEPSDHRLKP